MKTNLKPVRKAAGLTQAQAAELSGIPLGTLRRWEQGVNEPDMESVVRLAKLYNTSTDTLLGSNFADDLSSIARVKMVDVRSETERRLLDLFRNANDWAKSEALAMLARNQKSGSNIETQSA